MTKHRVIPTQYLLHTVLLNVVCLGCGMVAFQTHLNPKNIDTIFSLFLLLLTLYYVSSCWQIPPVYCRPQDLHWRIETPTVHRCHPGTSWPQVSSPQSKLSLPLTLKLGRPFVLKPSLLVPSWTLLLNFRNIYTCTSIISSGRLG